jgi:hypothetical protein
MTLRSEWTALAARIDGFLASTATYLQTLVPAKDDPYGGADDVLLPESARIYAELKQFAERHSSTLPPPACDGLHRFFEEHKDHFKPGWRAGWQGLKVIAPALGSVRSEVSFHLADFAATARRLSERAFIHLQRSIVADEDIRNKWKQAFAEREEHCEQLGAVHLLSHGIWAFKASAEGERTDLIFADQAIDESEAESAAEALVLTEWKKVKSSAERDTKARAARKQAGLYKAGSLASIELAAYGYIVLVSKRRLDPIDDLIEAGVTYKHINVAVDPKTPGA